MSCHGRETGSGSKTGVRKQKGMRGRWEGTGSCGTKGEEKEKKAERKERHAEKRDGERGESRGKEREGALCSLCPPWHPSCTALGPSMGQTTGGWLQPSFPTVPFQTCFAAVFLTNRTAGTWGSPIFPCIFKAHLQSNGNIRYSVKDHLASVSK